MKPYRVYWQSGGRLYKIGNNLKRNIRFDNDTLHDAKQSIINLDHTLSPQDEFQFCIIHYTEKSSKIVYIHKMPFKTLSKMGPQKQPSSVSKVKNEHKQIIYAIDCLTKEK